MTAVNAAMEAYDFNASTTGVYAFWQYDLCDVFIELMKPVVASSDESGEKDDARRALDAAGLWAAFVTPVHAFRHRGAVAEAASSPSRNRALDHGRGVPVADPANRSDDEIETRLGIALDAVKAIRALCASYGLAPKARPEVFAVCRSEESAEALTVFADAVSTLSGSGVTRVLEASDASEIPAGCGVTVMSESVSVYLSLRGSVDPAAGLRNWKSAPRLRRSRWRT